MKHVGQVTSKGKVQLKVHLVVLGLAPPDVNHIQDAPHKIGTERPGSEVPSAFISSYCNNQYRSTLRGDLPGILLCLSD
ncbi:hypothetical protein SKAU_G00297530 [Synaphobranchus kaupii]|uniref:Uncharacterized protein n=1 Tax=Synaphobranchus kaupii TaxID=118154 RepID=A0A9Q1EV34_SYNKA|nr:hypothetical protein SKAU_G00297530 [Synaphobranchus kaupii]